VVASAAVRGLARALAEWTVSLSRADLSDDIVERAKVSILDTVGVALAGSREPAARITTELVLMDGGVHAAPILGIAARVGAEAAAFVNGTAAHALDFDDNSDHFQGHPSAVVLPAALAVAEARSATMGELLAGYIAGVEVMAKTGRALGTTYYTKGWHATSVIGTLGAAAAAGKMLGVDVPRMEMALAIAASLASGTRQNFGTMTKALHVGHAARCGVAAARLAERGFTADVHALEGPLGFLELFGDGICRDPIGMLGAPFELLSPGITIKAYPSCSATHRALDGVLQLRGRLRLTGADVSDVSIRTPVGDLEPLIDRSPTTGLEAKFSMGYCVAAALYDGALGIGSFADEQITRGALREMGRRVSVSAHPPDAGLPHGHGEGIADIRIRTVDGKEVSTQVLYPRGSPQAPLSQGELVQKFIECAMQRLDRQRAERFVEFLWDADDRVPVAELTRRLAPDPSSR
jgi:2-methylcitrate dehydratase PrpD